MLKVQQKTTYVVGDEEFATEAEAIKYMESIDPAKLRLEAFIQHLRDTGAQRITATVRDTVKAFIAFEAGETEEVADLSPDVKGDTSTEIAPEKPQDTDVTMDDALAAGGDIVAKDDVPFAIDESGTEEKQDGPLTDLDSGSEDEVAEETQVASEENAKVSDLFGSDSLEPKEETKNLFG